MSNPLRQSVLIIGGGLAGLAAAAALAPRGFCVTLLESRNRLGGRASSFHDVASNHLVDTCQHVSMGCCTNLAHFCRTVGVAQYLEPQKALFFMTPDGRTSRFGADPWPAPFHLLRSFLSAHYLTTWDKLQIFRGLLDLRTRSDDDDPPFQDWLQQHGQSSRAVNRFWGLVLVSALNESPDRIGLRYARKVFVDGFLRHRRGFEIELPSVPLARLYGDEMQRWMSEHDVEVQLQKGGKRFHIADHQVERLELRSGESLHFDWYVSAVPFDRLLDLLPAHQIDGQPYFANLRNLETSPITSVHLWFDKPVLKLPHIVLVDCIGQWVFNRGRTESSEYYVQVVVSAARQFRGLGREEVERQVIEELRRLFAEIRGATLLRARVVTEHAATFSAVPGVDRWRPVQTSPLANLFVAGDWTATGWPATMEGAVRSGYLAAEALLQKTGFAENLVQPDLK